MDSTSIISKGDLIKCLEVVVESGLQLNSWSFIRYATLSSCLYISQSVAVDQLINLIVQVNQFIISDLERIQRPTDILTDW